MYQKVYTEGLRFHVFKFSSLECDIFVVVDSNFLLFAKKQEIRGVHLNDTYFNAIPALTMPYAYNPLAIDYDLNGQKIYWTDGDLLHRQKGIHSAFLNGTQVETIIDSGA